MAEAFRRAGFSVDGSGQRAADPKSAGKNRDNDQGKGGRDR
jgi:hypothetical protein